MPEVKNMPDLFRFDDSMEEYFSALPADLQYEIRHSNLKIGCLADLMQYAETLMEARYP